MPDSAPRRDANPSPGARRLSARPTTSVAHPWRDPIGDRANERTTAMLDAEVGRLLHELRPFRVMRGGELARRAGAEYWGGGGFDAAVRTGERRGDLRRLPFGYVELARRSRPR
ncbi:hypothetical protein [Conexibacter sp. DBS9H8]|uniref:hypothetical protein n=1 Tax=Conexibacter sp. DBS9H8 TaxID=2937801 RepID=UPI00200F8222|nr:hypothetical protein [Conexibacter sp. DBS9H8]